MSDTTTIAAPVGPIRPKPKTPRVVLFLAQPAGALVGRDKPFQSIEDLCRWAANECGFEGVSAPAAMDFLNIKLAAKGTPEGLDYCAATLARYARWGTRLVRLEMHTIGQRMLMHPATLVKFRGFAAADVPAMLSVHENTAEDEAMDVVNASGNLGFTELVDFSGERGWTAASYPWSAYPPQLRLYILLLLLMKHRKVLARCAELGIRRGFELHPGEDLNSPLLLYLFRELAKVVAPEIVAAIAANFDASHPTLCGDDAARHAVFLFNNGLLKMCHLKDAEVRRWLSPNSHTLQGGSIRGDYAPTWSDSLRRFCTFGTGMAPWGGILPVLKATHEEDPYGLDYVVEAECSRFPDMRQALRIAAENARRAIANQDFADVSKVVVRTPEGGNWEQFCTGNYPATELLGMNSGEIKVVEDLKARLPADLLEKYF